MTETSWSVTLPGSGVPLQFKQADPDGDAALVHDWMHEPHVAPWWGPDRSLDETRAYLVRQHATGHLVPWLVSYTDPATGRRVPFGYVETYRPADDPLAEYFPVLPTDRGWHVFVGPTDVRGTGLPRLMGRAVLAYLLSEPGDAPIERVICEPNELNTRMLSYCKALGYDTLAAVDLPTKRALILACTRAAFEERWPGDLAAFVSQVRR